MTDTCGSCFFGRLDTDGITLRCQFNAPSKVMFGPDFPGPRWPEVSATDGWCGDGADKTTGTPFNRVLGNVVTVATLPTGQPAGTRMFVSDARGPLGLGGAISGGGTSLCPVYCDGSNNWFEG